MYTHEGRMAFHLRRFARPSAPSQTTKTAILKKTVKCFSVVITIITSIHMHIAHQTQGTASGVGPTVSGTKHSFVFSAPLFFFAYEGQIPSWSTTRSCSKLAGRSAFGKYNCSWDCSYGTDREFRTFQTKFSKGCCKNGEGD